MFAPTTGAAGFSRGRCPCNKAFTLIELLLAICIIAVLLCLLAATLGQAWDVATDVQCKHNLSQLHKALHMGRDVVFPNPVYWVGFVESIGCAESLICPQGDTSRPEAYLPPIRPRNPYPQAQVDDAPLPPPPPDVSCPEQDIEPSRPPESIMIGAHGALESDTLIREFQEQKNFTLPVNVKTNISGPGYYDSFASMTGSVVGAGTRVNCYFLHFDPVGSAGAQVSGRMNFNGDILGVICRDAELDASDPIVGCSGTQYPTGTKSRGFESSQEIVSISADQRTLTINRFWSSTVGEQMRILVKAKAPDAPAPSRSVQNAPRPAAFAAWDEETEYDVGGPTSYAMNRMATPSDAWPGQVLLLEFRRTIADLGSGGAGDYENLRTNLAPRHSGHVNVLFVDGHVEGLAPEELLPNPAGLPWIGRNGWTPTP